MTLSVNTQLCSDELCCPFDQLGVAVGGATQGQIQDFLEGVHL